MSYPRVAGRIGNIVNLNMTMLRNNVPQTPYALRSIDIYQGFIRGDKKVAEIIFSDPSDTAYPYPAVEVSEGEFIVPFEIPDTFNPCEIYYDVWNFVGADPAPDSINDQSLWVSQTGMFWAYDDVWLVDDELFTKRIGFEPLDKKFRKKEIRTLEVAIHPLPMYDYDFNKLAPLIPQLNPTIEIWTTRCELLIQDAPCRIGIRQGHNRNSPFVIQYTLDTTSLFVGMYKYIITVNLGNETIKSPEFSLSVQ